MIEESEREFQKLLFSWKMHTKVGTEDHPLPCWEWVPHPIRPALGWRVAQFCFQLYVVVLGQMLTPIVLNFCWNGVVSFLRKHPLTLSVMELCPQMNRIYFPVCIWNMQLSKCLLEKKMPVRIIKPLFKTDELEVSPVSKGIMKTMENSC